MFTEEVIQYGEDTIKNLADNKPDKALGTQALMHVYSIMNQSALHQEAYHEQKMQHAAVLATFEVQNRLLERIVQLLEAKAA
jgi:hypothetical protein